MASKYQQSPAAREVLNWEFNAIQMGYGRFKFNSPASFSASNPAELVRVHFGLKGDYCFTYSQLGQRFDLVGGHHNIMYSKGLDIEVENKTPEIETFGIDFPPDIFLSFSQGAGAPVDGFVEAIMSGRPALLSPTWGSVTTKIQSLIDEICLNPYSGKLQEIFLLSKCLELLVCCVANYQETLDVKERFLKSPQDKEKIIASRDFINERIASPPNLSEISKAVGINEFKLKRGFKEMFGSTVFGYLTERRLNLARQYLRDSRKTAAEIAFELGYSSPQHFSSQFRQYYGQTPNSVRKNP